MKTLIAGGSGFIGSHLARRLLEAGHEVHIADNLSRGVLDADLRDLIDRPSARLIEADLLDGKAIDALDRDYDLIFHLAAIVGVQNVLGAPYRVLHDNVALCFALIDLARSQRGLGRFVFASTSEVYAGTLERFDLDIPTPETAPIALPDLSAPRTSYMLSKLYGEALCHHAGVPFTVIRPHNVYGPRMGLSHVIPELLKRAHEEPDGGRLEVFSPTHRRTFCFIDDAVAIVHAAAEAPGAAGEVLNVGTQSPELTIEELARVVTRTVGKELELVPGPIHPGSPERRAPDTSKADVLTGHRTRVPVEEGVGRTYDWYREHAFAGV